MDKKRLFIAVDLPENIKEEITKTEKEIDKKIGENLEWINPEKLHLTILFLGYQDEKNLVKIRESLEKLEKPGSFSIKINRVDYGPIDIAEKRMVWLIFDKSKELIGFQKNVVKEINERSINYQKDYRNYLPHINLIRFKERAPKTEIAKTLNLEFKVDKFSLKESVLKRSGAEYSDLGIFRLNDRIRA